METYLFRGRQRAILLFLRLLPSLQQWAHMVANHQMVIWVV